MKIFVTGGSGFIGGHVLEVLGAGHEVVAMARSPRSAERVERWGATPIACSLDDVTATHLADCDAVVHCAAYVEEYGPRSAFWHANVTGTERLLAAASAAGVSRFVHISSEAVLYTADGFEGCDESADYPTKHLFPYSETKAVSEQRVLDANDDDAMQTIALRPALVWGPRDTTILPAVVRMAEGGDWRWIDDGKARTSTTHVRNLVAAVEQALTQGKPGAAYHVTDGEDAELREFLTELVATQGVSLPDRSVPRWLARPLAGMLEGTWRAFRVKKTPPLTRFAAWKMSTTATVTSSTAEAELGYRPVVDVASGLAALAS